MLKIPPSALFTLLVHAGIIMPTSDHTMQYKKYHTAHGGSLLILLYAAVTGSKTGAIVLLQRVCKRRGKWGVLVWHPDYVSDFVCNVFVQ